MAPNRDDPCDRLSAGANRNGHLREYHRVQSDAQPLYDCAGDPSLPLPAGNTDGYWDYDIRVSSLWRKVSQKSGP